MAVLTLIGLLIFWQTLQLGSSELDNLRGGILYPRESESREVKSLDGIWNFRLADPNDLLAGFREKWFAKDLSQSGPVIDMPVPSSYNDITQDKKVRDHVGTVWYDRTFYVPDWWKNVGNRVWIRFGSVHYAAQVWINGHLVTSHEIGHLPFTQEITNVLLFGKRNRVTVAVDNTLLQTTVPQGTLQELVTDDGVKITQSYTFDFFNYAGIHRSVHLYTTPAVYVDDISVETGIEEDGTGIIKYAVSISGTSATKDNSLTCHVALLDKEGKYADYKNTNTDNSALSGIIQVANATLWWPYLMNPKPGYMYTLQVTISMKGWGSEDVYRLPVGIRTLRWNSTTFLINNEPIYIRGFGRHEDSYLRGKGLDMVLVAKDYNLIKWVGANAYRTSHYPYAEEIMDFADQNGIMIIDECPSVDAENYSAILRKKHVDSLAELIRRDKNRPSVVMWSVANEPRTQLPEADSYFRYVTSFVRSVDVSRPITAAIAVSYASDELAHYLDIIGFNRYNSWYSNTGHTEIIRSRVEDEVSNWHQKFNKPIFMAEYGADTIPGLHSDPSFVWSEEYQVQFMSEHFKAFDNLRKQRFFIGEMIWNFADFNTGQSTTRVGGNKKGIFTRDRQPKSSAHHLRKRYWALAQELDNATSPLDIVDYIKSGTTIWKTDL